jgi:cytidine deaminase
MSEEYERVSDVEFQQLLSDDHRAIAYANKIRLQLPSSPPQSQFRVVAILFIKYDEDKLRLICGTNTEPGYIGGSICAERAAICRLRFLSRPRILKIAIATDNDQPY